MLQLAIVIPLMIVLALSLCARLSASEEIGRIRLIGGTSPQEGRVEIYYNGHWGTVCDNSWGLEDANVTCRQLGFGEATSAPRDATFGEGTGPIWLDDVSCTGSESRLEDCSNSKWGINYCEHSKDAGVICDSGTPYYKNVRLVDGNSSSEGRVEVFSNNEWFTICDKNFDSYDADVICRHLGFVRALRYFDGAHYGQGYGPILGDIYCLDIDVTTFNECGLSDWHSSVCSHSEDVGLQCTSDYPASPGYGDVRLVDGSSPSEGRVEIFYNNEWATICDDYFDIYDAEVICGQLGYAGVETYYGRAYYGEGNGLNLAEIHCNGYETSWDYCRVAFWGSYCSHSQDVGLKCAFDGETVRLVDGNSRYEGRVEIYNEGEWGTICENNFDMDNANVLCRQLGYSRALAYYTVSIFDEGTGPIMGLLDCIGYESDWISCHYDDWGTIGCTHSEDVGIRCVPGGKGWIGLVVGLVMFISLVICCGIGVCIVKRSKNQQQRPDTTTEVNQLATTQPLMQPNVTNETPAGACPPKNKDMISTPDTNPLQDVQTNPAFPPLHNPQYPYPTQQGVTYPVLPGVDPYPATETAVPYSPQTGVPSYLAQPVVSPYPQQSDIVSYPPQTVNPNETPASAPIYPNLGTQSEMYQQQGYPQTEPSAPPAEPGEWQILEFY